MNKQFAITGIGTDVGKTVVSAILSEALHATYWKPVQAGDLNNSDSIKVNTLTSNVAIHPEVFKLSEPISPHAAANSDGVLIQLNDLSLPEISGNLIVEGAGGLMVPLNDKGLTFADVIESWKLPTILVSRHYLGSINHSLLTAEVLRYKGVFVEGIIFVGAENRASEEIILKATGLKNIARIPLAETLDKNFIAEQAVQIKPSL